MKSWLLASKILGARAAVVKAAIITTSVIALEVGVITVYKVVNETPPAARGGTEAVEQPDHETSQEPSGSTPSISMSGSEILIPEQASARSEYQPPPP